MTGNETGNNQKEHDNAEHDVESFDVCGSPGGGVSGIGLGANRDRCRSDRNGGRVRGIRDKLDGNWLWRDRQRKCIDSNGSVFEGDWR